MLPKYHLKCSFPILQGVPHCTAADLYTPNWFRKSAWKRIAE